jgi:hypothetical protein
MVATFIRMQIWYVKLVKELRQNLSLWVCFEISLRDFIVSVSVQFNEYFTLIWNCTAAWLFHVSGGELLASHLRSTVSLELLTVKVSLGQVSLEYFGVLCQYESTILTLHPHTTHAIHINLAKCNFVTWNTFSTELPSSKVMNTKKIISFLFAIIFSLLRNDSQISRISLLLNCICRQSIYDSHPQNSSTIYKF